MTRKVWNKKLIKIVLGKVWGVDTRWDHKIIEQNDYTCIIGLSFKDG